MHFATSQIKGKSLQEILFPNYYRIRQEVETIINNGSTVQAEKIKKLHENHEKTIKTFLRTLEFTDDEQEEIMHIISRVKKEYAMFPFDTTDVTHDWSALPENLVAYCKQRLIEKGFEIEKISITNDSKLSNGAYIDPEFKCDTAQNPMISIATHPKINFNARENWLLSDKAIKGIINHEIAHAQEGHIIEQLVLNALYKKWLAKNPDADFYMEKIITNVSIAYNHSSEYSADQLPALESIEHAQEMKECFSFFSRRFRTLTNANKLLFALMTAIPLYMIAIAMSTKFSKKDKLYLQSGNISSLVLLLSFCIVRYCIKCVTHPSDYNRYKALKEIICYLTLEKQLREKTVATI